ncbi:hypothetical protein ABT023_05640 [Micromonospora sp. NPDC002296]|uniref:hypothetical protein n=1 Tax=Micromonospora sp. NPDC002296 TaxID=3154271 RepID=UPI0033331667
MADSRAVRYASLAGAIVGVVRGDATVPLHLVQDTQLRLRGGATAYMPVRC